MRSRILVVPSVAALDDFAHLMGHLGHYFSHVGPERVVVLIEPDMRADAERWLSSPVLPDGFGDAVHGRVARLADAVELVDWPADLDNLALTSDLVIDWHAERSELRPWRDVRVRYRLNRSWFEIDWRRRRLGASWLADAARVITSGRGFDPSARSHTKALVTRLGVAEKAYLVATGPSARSALEHDLSDGIRIVCNTVVLDDELMEHVRPNVLTFADPIYHFGPSTYAERFQRAVVEQSERHDFAIVTTERFAPLLRAHAPEVADRVIGLRQGRSDWPENFDLSHRAAVRPHPNILTMLMLPLATTLARSATLFGFDGRDPDDEYFWKHGRTVQFDTEMEHIRRVHPGFFDVDYEDYYHSHVATLDRILNLLDARGYPVQSETPSHISPLRRRGGVVREPQGTAYPVQDRPMLVSLTPDWIEGFGHFGPFERRVRESAGAAGFEHIALASLGLRPDASWQLPLFTEASYGTFPVRFEEELGSALESLSPRDGSVVAFYTADVWHVPMMHNLARQYPGLRFAANLMRTHDWLSDALTTYDPRARAQLNLLTACLELSAGSNVDVAVDTPALQRDVELLTGHRPLIWPMITASNLGTHHTAHVREDSVHVVAPVHAQHVKGFPQVVELAERLRGRLERGEMVLSARCVRQPTGAPARIDQLAERFIAAGGRLMRDNLTDDEYAELVRSADIVLVPYRLDPFRTRTSGVVLDALLAGKPVVAVRGTWGGELIERFGAGATYEDGSVTQLLHALEHVSDHLEAFEDKVANAWPEIYAQHHPDRLIEFLQQRAKADVTVEVTTEDATRVTYMAAQLRDLFRWKDVTTASASIAAVVRDDDRLRSIDEFQDRLEQMERAIRWRDRRARHTTSRESPSTNLDQLVFPRSARAHIDEVALVAGLVDPDGRRPGRMVDVGAHRGSALNHFIRRGWTIRAFEADARHATELRAKFADDERVVIDERAVTDVTGDERTFYVSAESTGISGLSAFRESHMPAGVVRTVALRDALEGQHVNVLKIDTEGFDLHVLRGFPWEHDVPDVIVCEFEDSKTQPLGYTANDLGDFLVGKGYQVWVSEWHPIVRYGIRHDWHRLAPYPAESLSPNAWGNLIAFKQSRTEAVMSAAVAATVEAESVPLPAHENTSPPSSSTSRTQRDDRPRLSTAPNEGASNARLQPALGNAEADLADSEVQETGTEPPVRERPAVRQLSSRRHALPRAMRGSLMGPLLVGVLAFTLSIVTAIVEEPRLAAASGAIGGLFVGIALLIVAVRVDRRTNEGGH